ncbi:Crossover junction endonuclease mus81 [Aspergillus nanangensis]|uniref:Crossover junction endonuclease MUS81 n=1 Tax=Aspergillus nanangensis TaxID=2582783 RepID=A0AAD4CUS9_ASPNN|nr:Crossover junction endonuclease mus81 [Aspergillus nanangensis]
MSDSCGNPLLLEWIKEWLDEARERNSKGVIVYKKAYESMKACPLVFQHPSEAQQLNGLGPKLCDRLTEKLKAYCEENSLPVPDNPNSKNNRDGSSKRTSEDDPSNNQATKKARKPRPYVPTLRSGPYALVLGLATLGENSTQGLTKPQLIEKAQPFCDSSFTAPDDPKKFFTAWNSMKSLLQKDLVYDHGHPLKKYALTEDGWEVAKRMIKTLPESIQSTFQEKSDILGATRDGVSHGGTTNDPFQPIDNLNTNTLDPAAEDIPVTPIVLPPDSFTVQLVLDTREVRTSKDRDYISNELHRKGVMHDVRALELGDVMWVAKFHDPAFLTRYGEEGDEVMLDYIVERKRLDDLLGSIKDGRFHEQKFRLNRSGMKNVIYLIEECSISHDPGSAVTARYQEMVASAIASTQVVNGYFVKKTKNIDDTIRYLTRMTFLLDRMYTSAMGSGSGHRPLSLIPSRQLSSAQSYLDTLERLQTERPSETYAVTFSTFSILSSKSEVLALRDVFLKMLMCTRGVTGEKALEIQRRWQTPQAFITAFEALGSTDRDTMVSDQVKSLIGRKSVGKALGKKIAEVWGEEG